MTPAADATGSVTFNISVDNTGESPVISSRSDGTSRSDIGNVSWEVGSWTDGVSVDTPDVGELVETIVNTSGYDPDDSDNGIIQFFITQAGDGTNFRRVDDESNMTGSSAVGRGPL